MSENNIKQFLDNLRRIEQLIDVIENLQSIKFVAEFDLLRMYCRGAKIEICRSTSSIRGETEEHDMKDLAAQLNESIMPIIQHKIANLMCQIRVLGANTKCPW